MKKEQLVKIISLGISAILLIIILVLIGGMISDRRNAADTKEIRQQEKTVSSGGKKLFDNVEIVKEEVTFDIQTVQDGLKNMGTLVTQEYYFTQVEEYTNTKEALFLKSTAKFTFSYDGLVTAGIKCDDIQVTKDDEAHKITIAIPASELQNVEIDTESFKVYEEKNGVWNKTDLSMYNEALDHYIKTAKEKALEKGILEKADENARRIIENFVNSLVDTSEYTIEYVQR